MPNKLPQIIDVMEGEGVVLVDKGSYYQGKCPLHNDNNPSFIVYKETETFYCFGCKEWGDVISFIMKLKFLTFTEALQYLDINDFKFKRPHQLKPMIDMIADEQEQGEDVYKKYGKEFIDTLIARELTKLVKDSHRIDNKS